MGNAIQFHPGGRQEPGKAGNSHQFVDPDTGEALDFSQILPGVAGSVESPAVIAQPVAPAKKTQKVDKTETFDVIKAAKQRLRYLKKEIKTLRKLEKEQVQLEKLLAAAEKPLAIVSPINAKRSAK